MMNVDWWLNILIAIFTFLWSLLFIIPGIVKAYSYAMTPYIVHDNPEMPVRECIRQSQRMMKGYKMKLFLLDLSFIGWILLGIFSFGIGLLWVLPYMETARMMQVQTGCCSCFHSGSRNCS